MKPTQPAGKRSLCQPTFCSPADNSGPGPILALDLEVGTVQPSFFFQMCWLLRHTCLITWQARSFVTLGSTQPLVLPMVALSTLFGMAAGKPSLLISTWLPELFFFKQKVEEGLRT